LRSRQIKEKRLPVIGFDLNGVLADADSKLFALIKQEFGLNITNITKYGEAGHRLAEYINNNARAHAWIRNTVNDPEFILSLEPIPNAVEVWNSLKDVERRVVSGHENKRETILATERWLENHKFTNKADFTKYKDAWCHQVQAKWLVEDSPLHAIECSEAGTTVLLLDKIYNKSCEGNDIIRISSLLDIPALIKESM